MVNSLSSVRLVVIGGYARASLSKISIIQLLKFQRQWSSDISHALLLFDDMQSVILMHVNADGWMTTRTSLWRMQLQIVLDRSTSVQLQYQEIQLVGPPAQDDQESKESDPGDSSVCVSTVFQGI
jgi:hypothetical protein